MKLCTFSPLDNKLKRITISLWRYVWKIFEKNWKILKFFLKICTFSSISSSAQPRHVTKCLRYSFSSQWVLIPFQARVANCAMVWCCYPWSSLHLSDSYCTVNEIVKYLLLGFYLDSHWRSCVLHVLTSTDSYRNDVHFYKALKVSIQSWLCITDALHRQWIDYIFLRMQYILSCNCKQYILS